MLIQSTDLHIESISVDERGYIIIEFEKPDDDIPKPAIYVAVQCTPIIESGNTINVEL